MGLKYKTIFYFIAFIFLFNHTIAQKKKNPLSFSFEADAGAPVILSNQAFRNTYSGAVCAGGGISVYTPNLKHQIGLKYQHGNFKAGLNTLNINQEITTQIYLNSAGIRYGYYLYKDDMFHILMSLSALKSFANAHETECEPSLIKNISFYSIQPEMDFFIKAQDYVFAGLKLSYQNNLHVFDPNDFCLNKNNIYSPESYRRNVSFLYITLSVKVDLIRTKNPDLQQ